MDHHSMQQHHHNIQNAQNNHQIHWNYSPTATSTVSSLTSTPIAHSNTNIINNNNSNSSTSSNNNTWTPPTTRGLKRAMSESDCDDLFSDSESKELASSIENDSCQLMSRKKRRGVIEKKRRDRINSSLTELKRLVPSAFEKQGSAKLEKAEILQLTVDHLKILHSKGIDSIGFDPQRFAMDYHIIGFRECASEVARYMISVEGMDIQDPMRLRLMSHLQCFVAQRELSVKTSGTPGSTNTNWQNSYQPNYSTQSYQSYPTPQITPNNQQHAQQHHQNSFNSSYMTSPTTSYSNTSNNSSLLSSTATSQLPDYSSAYVASDSSSANTSAIPTTLYATNNNNGYNNTNNSKPYRPWHPEMSAY
ncbi:unnamed protein product [Diamesa tonsa]